MTGPRVDVFVSHSSEDKGFVDRLVDDLESERITTWYDKQDLRVGQSIVGEINEALRSVRYLLIVLSPRSVRSKWVQEELNAGLMRQIAAGGVFLLPALFEPCEIPPLLAHRRLVDFSTTYSEAFVELVEVIKSDEAVRARLESDQLYPLPSGEDDSGGDHVFVQSSRFDRCFKMSASMDGDVNNFLSHAISALSLPWEYVDGTLGFKWRYRYGLVVAEEKAGLKDRLGDVVSSGDVVRISINATYEDTFEKELQQLRESMLLMTPEVLQRISALEAAVAEPGRLSRTTRRESADLGFAHIDVDERDRS